MGLKTLKIGDSCTIKDTGKQALIVDIAEGKYSLKGHHKTYRSTDIEGIKTAPAIKRNLRINKVSASQSVLNQIYAVLRREWMPHNKTCVAQFPGCTHKATEIHHMYKREGWWLIVSRYFLPICRSCHRHATKNSKEAIQKGVSISRNSINEPLLDFNDYEKKLIKSFGLQIPTNNERI